MKNTQKERELELLEKDYHFKRGEVSALRQARRDLEAVWLRAEMDCNLKEVEYAHLSREADRVRREENPE